MRSLKNFDYWHRFVSYLFLYVFASVVMMLFFQIAIIIQYGSFDSIDVNNFIQALLGGMRGSLKLFAFFILPFFLLGCVLWLLPWQKPIKLLNRFLSYIGLLSFVFIFSISFVNFSSYLYSAARAIDNRAIKTFRQRKSIGKETTFLKDLSKKEEALVILEKLSQQVLDSMKQKKISAKTLTLKLKYTDFQSITRSQTRKEGYHSLAELLETLELLIEKTDIGKRKIRLLGMSLSNLDSD